MPLRRSFKQYHKENQNKSWATNPAARGLVPGELGGAEAELGQQAPHLVAAPHGALLDGLSGGEAWGRNA